MRRENRVKHVGFGMAYIASPVLLSSGKHGIPNLAPSGYWVGWPGLIGLTVACISAAFHLSLRGSPYSGPDAEIDDPTTTLDLNDADRSRANSD